MPSALLALLVLLLAAPLPTPAPGAYAGQAKPAAEEEDDDEDDEDDDEDEDEDEKPAAPKPKPKPEAKASDDEDDEDDEPKKEEKPVIAIRIPADARSWSPVSVRKGAAPSSSSFKRRYKTLTGTPKTESSPASAAARVHKAGLDRLLIVSVYPKSLLKQRKHLELRFFVIEGFLEKATLAAVTASDAVKAGHREDSRTLRAKGWAFSEEEPSSARVVVGALSLKPGTGTRNAGTVSLASFGDTTLGSVDFTFAAKGFAKP